MQIIFAGISLNLPEKFWAAFWGLHEYRISDDLQKNIKTSSCLLGAIFSNQSMLVAIFACSFREFAQIFRDFAKISTDFAQISTDFALIFRDFSWIFTNSKLLGVSLHPLNYRLLHQWPNRLTSALYSTLNAIVASYDAKRQQWICKFLMFLWFNNIAKAVTS